jgi:ABC-2 type transport system ATP-binding protein
MLLLGEPLASLDPLARREFLQSLMAIAASAQITVVMSSHLIGELARVCDHLVVISGGRLLIAGELDQVVDEHAGSPDRPPTWLPCRTPPRSSSRSTIGIPGCWCARQARC